jgi:hypothetical protein
MPEGLRVNFSDKEAESQAREPLPSGKYHVKITDVSLETCGPESKNPDKHYWAIEFTVQEGKYSDRKCWTNCMLFEGALYTLSQLMKATGYDVTQGDVDVPEIDDLIGQDVQIRVIVKRADEEKGYDARNEVKGIMKWDDGSGIAGSSSGGKASALLP